MWRSGHDGVMRTHGRFDRPSRGARSWRFDHTWRVDADAEAVLALLEDVRGYGTWWRAVRVTGGSAAAGARTGDLEVRAPIGYRIRITLTEQEPQGRGELRAAISGDLEGWSSWRVTREGAATRVDFTQEVDVRDRGLRAVSPLLRAALTRQHDAVMRSAERGMRAAL